MNSSEKLATIQRNAKEICDACEQLEGGTTAVCMKLASEIFELADSILTSKDMEEHYGLRVDRHNQDGDGVNGNREKLRNVRYKTDEEDQRSRRCHQALELSRAARARTQAAKKKRPVRSRK